MLALSYPHIEKGDNQPARLQRLPRIRVAQTISLHLLQTAHVLARNQEQH